MHATVSPVDPILRRAAGLGPPRGILKEAGTPPGQETPGHPNGGGAPVVGVHESQLGAPSQLRRGDVMSSLPPPFGGANGRGPPNEKGAPNRIKSNGRGTAIRNGARDGGLDGYTVCTLCSLPSSSSALLPSLELSDSKVYEP